MNHATISGCQAALRSQLIDALMHDPDQPVSTPGFNVAQMTAAAVIEDQLASVGNEVAMRELLSIVAQVASGKFSHALHLKASAWIAEQANKHAKYHAADMAQYEEDKQALVESLH